MNLRRVGQCVVLSVLMCAASGALAQTQKDDGKDGGGGGMFGDKKPKPKQTETEQPRTTTPTALAPVERKTGAWSIVLAAFRGDQQVAEAREMLSKITEQKELASAFVDQRGGGKATVVAVGRFADPSSPEALAALEKVRAITVGGKKAYAGAFLAPPGELTNLGQRPEYNLSRAKEQFGDRAAYSLQVAVYGRKDIIDSQNRAPTEEELKEARKAAEDAAATLRQEGELAFYFHGPRFSMVTIGVWTDQDFAAKGDPQAGVPARSENPELSALRKRFPHNLYNGAGVKVKSKGVEGEIQPSFTVKIPQR